jgi:hypothetical protein
MAENRLQRHPPGAYDADGRLPTDVPRQFALGGLAVQGWPARWVVLAECLGDRNFFRDFLVMWSGVSRFVGAARYGG